MTTNTNIAHANQENNLFLVALLAAICALPPLATDMYFASGNR